MHPIFSGGRIRIKSVVVEKEVCRLEITGDQLLFSCGPEHYSNLVNVSEYPAEQMSTGDFFYFIFTKWAVTGQPQTFAGIIAFFFNVSLLGTGDMGEIVYQGM